MTVATASMAVTLSCAHRLPCCIIGRQLPPVVCGVPAWHDIRAPCRDAGGGRAGLRGPQLFYFGTQRGDLLGSERSPCGCPDCVFCPDSINEPHHGGMPNWTAGRSARLPYT